ncbi:MAG: DNA repair protein RecN [Candidatus Krumholzibacteriota bacterium]|nr:DNA repair protein RecN [Candidatus Krumholzibacteriota bacterium]
MLQELLIRNLAVVEDAAIIFDNGLNVITGSTGAGKSIILTAVDLLSGGRARKSLLRKGADKLCVEGRFLMPGKMDISGIPGIDIKPGSQVSVKREIGFDGRSRLWINDRTASNQDAKRLSEILLELNSQHRHQELLDPSSHIAQLDGSGPYVQLLERCDEAIELFRNRWKDLDALRKKERENREREDYFRFQLKQLDALGLDPGMDDQLATRIKKLENLHSHARSIEESRSLLSEGEGSILEKMSALERLLGKLSMIDQSWSDSKLEIEEMIISLEEIDRTLEHSESDDEDDPADLEYLQNRLAAIQSAKRKFATDFRGLIEKRDELRSSLRSLEDGSDEMIESSSMLQKAKEGLLPLLKRLSDERKKHAKSIDEEITMELQGLGMNGAVFKTSIKTVEIKAFIDGADELDLHPGGWDRVEFMIRTNVGEQMHPLSEVASGGELSRITLVLKRLLVRKKGIPTLIFDEIDSGLGADLGAVVAEKMEELADNYQIITITHLPQVAAAGNQHILIEKKVLGGRTITKASVLGKEERKIELARMLGGRGDLREKLASELLGNKEKRP